MVLCGSISANVGNSALGVGIDTDDGNWYMDKDTRKDNSLWVILQRQIMIMLLQQ